MLTGTFTPGGIGALLYLQAARCSMDFLHVPEQKLQHSLYYPHITTTANSNSHPAYINALFLLVSTVFTPERNSRFAVLLLAHPRSLPCPIAPANRPYRFAQACPSSSPFSSSAPQTASTFLFKHLLYAADCISEKAAVTDDHLNKLVPKRKSRADRRQRGSTGPISLFCSE